MITPYAENVFVVPGLLNHEQCLELINRGESTGFQPAAVRFTTGTQMRPTLRNNDRAEAHDRELAYRLWSLCQPFLPSPFEGGRPVGLDDHFRFYRYDVGQTFKRHMDGVTQKSATVRTRFTCLIYLNQDFEGGETVFFATDGPNGTRPEVAAVVPREGSVLFLTHEWWHEGRAPSSGRKYVLRTDVLYEFPDDVEYALIG